MAQKYYNVKEAAKLLGISDEAVKRMQEQRELHGYRDGADWKFKAEDIERAAKERAAAPPPAPQDEGDVLASEVELGQSDIATSGTVIGMEAGKAPAESDILLVGAGIEPPAGESGPARGAAKPPESDVRLAESDVKLAESGIQLGESDVQLAEAKPAKDDMGKKVSQFEELDLTLDQDLTLEDSGVGKAAVAKPAAGKPAAKAAAKKPAPAAAAGDSTVDLSSQPLDDDDLVLGGSSGTGSDVSIGGDSGISLVDPADSGLSLEEPLALGGDESLELGEDELSISAGDSSEALTQLKTDDDFLLTPMEDTGEGDDSESGSQVIALDTEGEGDEAATMIAGRGGMAAMLDEDLSEGAALGLAGGVPLAGAGIGELAQPGAMGLGEPVAVLPEAPYSIWNVLALFVCVFLLVLTGMMMYDLMKNMWSWDGTYTVNSRLMDWVLSWFEK